MLSLEEGVLEGRRRGTPVGRSVGVVKGSPREETTVEVTWFDVAGPMRGRVSGHPILFPRVPFRGRG